MADTRLTEGRSAATVRISWPQGREYRDDIEMDLDTAIEEARPEPAVYVLSGSQENFLYKGACRNLVERLKAHRAGRVRHTKGKRPLELMYFEYRPDYSDALEKEMFLKSGQGRSWLKSHLARVVEWQTQGT